MAVSLANIRAELLPGLMAVNDPSIPVQWDRVFAAKTVAAPIMLGPCAVVALGAAAVVVKNPEISRRKLFGLI